MTRQNTRYSKAKFLLCFAITLALLATVSHIWGLSPIDEKMQKDYKISVVSVDEVPVDTHTAEPADKHEAAEDEPSDSEDAATCLPTMLYSAKIWSYSECFSDSNAVQLEAASRNGIVPVSNRDELAQLVVDNKLTCISSSPYYIIDELTHSSPYLVPKAQRLLNTIGLNFIDSLQSKGMELHLPIVTSVLRTSDDIRDLQNGNGNSVTNSCHCYATTIDITYNRFMPISRDTPTCYSESLKKVLAEVLFDLREQGKCYVKHERQQACFHLTVR